MGGLGGLSWKRRSYFELSSCLNGLGGVEDRRPLYLSPETPTHTHTPRCLIDLLCARRHTPFTRTRHHVSAPTGRQRGLPKKKNNNNVLNWTQLGGSPRSADTNSLGGQQEDMETGGEDRPGRTHWAAPDGPIDE